MNEALPGKRQQNSQRTRDKLITAALDLYGSSSIDAVSLREISAAAGQKNPNALQYHFRDRDGLLQAIIDRHSSRIATRREAYLQRAAQGEWPPGEASARCLVMPIIDYVESDPSGMNYVNVVSQIAAIYQNGGNADAEAGIRFPEASALAKVFDVALATLPPREAQRRIYLVVTITFHTIADIYRAGAQQPPSSPIANTRPMVEQLVCLLDNFFSAPGCAS